LDIDAHHGNGTQEIFYETNKVLYLSLHQDPRGFPGTGFIDDVGEHEGRGYTVNLPFPFRTPDKVYLKAFDHVVVPIARQYKPEFILVSVGFDGYYADPVGALSLSAHLYTKVFSKILNLASQSCNGKLVAILEGGYHLAALGRMTSSVIARLAGAPYTLKSKRSWQPSARVVRRAERVLDEVKRVQSMFWSFENS
jgi:acetoin utilization deacetylase AcuC-like enzyme